MTRLGFYIVHNNRYKLVKAINVPWDFTIGGPDDENPVVDMPIIGSDEYFNVDENGNIIPPTEGGEDTDDKEEETPTPPTEGEDENEGIALQEDETEVEPSEPESPEEPDEQEPEKPKQSFEEWFMNYFYREIATDRNFFNVFNTDRTYIIIAEEDISVMGFMITYKGRTILNFEEHDYRNIINSMFPDIRQVMIIPDESFGGYDEDKDFAHDRNPDCSFGGYGDDKEFFVEDESENKGLDTYPNLF